MAFLLDVNVLLALMDEAHVHHAEAHSWFDRDGREAWATCPITQNAVLRILGNSRYHNTPGPPHVVLPILRMLCESPGHCFWSDDVSLLGNGVLDAARLLTTADITDTYLLALARAHGGKLATLDRRLKTAAVPDGQASLHLIG